MKEEQELKTLDDIEPLVIEGTCCCHDSIRREAIKWIKADKSNYYSKIGKEETILWIKHFFNIKESDLDGK